MPDVPDPYAWRAPQPDEPSIQTGDGRTIDPLNLGAVLPHPPVNPLARLIVSQTPTRTLDKADGTALLVRDEPLPKGHLRLIARAARLWALRQLHAAGTPTK